MTKTRVIRVFSFILAMTLVFAMMSTSAYADYRQFAAWMASALTAINITVESTIAPALQLGNELNSWLTSPFKVEAQQIIDIPYTFSDNDLETILNRSTLSISGNTVTIDGIDYTDIWLSHDAASKFRVNAFDLENAWDIASESEGTFVSGAGSYDGMPVYNHGNVPKTQEFEIGGNGTYSLGNGSINADANTTTPLYSVVNRYRNSVGGYYVHRMDNVNYPEFVHFERNSSIWNMYIRTAQGISSSSVSGSVYIDEPFDFDWVAGIIPAEPLDEEDGLHVLVPNNPEQWNDIPEAQQVINNINNYYELNPDLAPGVDVDLNTPGIIDKVDDLFDLINGIIKLTRAINSPKGDTPVDPVEPDPKPEPYPDPQPEPYPDPDPDPTTPLTDINWKSLFDVLKNIFQKLSNIDVTSQTIANTLTEFRNRFEYWMKDIRDNIVNKFDELSNILQEILDTLHDLADSIVLGNVDWFRDIVDSIWHPFLRIFAIFKTHIGIWHYVVDWIQSIGAPFRFFFGILTNMGALYTSPIYACFAGILVIAVYRRFGR